MDSNSKLILILVLICLIMIGYNEIRGLLIHLLLFLVGESKYCSAIACWTHPVAFRVLVRGRGFDASSSIA